MTTGQKVVGNKSGTIAVCTVVQLVGNWSSSAPGRGFVGWAGV